MFQKVRHVKVNVIRSSKNQGHTTKGRQIVEKESLN